MQPKLGPASPSKKGENKQPKRRLFLSGTGSGTVTAPPPVVKQLTTKKSPTKKLKPAKVIRLKRVHDAFEEMHPIRKKPRRSPRKDPSQRPTHSKIAISKSPEKNMSEVAKTLSVFAKPTDPSVSSPAKKVTQQAVSSPGDDTPTKMVFLPIAGIVPKLAVASTSQPTTGLYYLSPDKALKRPLKRSCSEQCINQMAQISPEKGLMNPEPSVEYWPIEEEDKEDIKPQEEPVEKEELEDGEEFFPICKSFGNRKKNQQNFVKIDMKHKRFTRATQKLKGAALKRFLYRKRTGQLKRRR